MKTKRLAECPDEQNNYMSDEAFGDLKQALEDALAFERGERRDLSLRRIQGSRPPKRHARLRSHKAKPIPAVKPAL